MMSNEGREILLSYNVLRTKSYHHLPPRRRRVCQGRRDHLCSTGLLQCPPPSILQRHIRGESRPQNPESKSPITVMEKYFTSCFQEVNIRTLCESVPALANQRCSQLVHNAQFINITFQKAFTLFGRCHSSYDNGKELSDNDIAALGGQSMARNRYLVTLFHF